MEEDDLHRISYHESRVMRHLREGHEEYAIHDVYFTVDGEVITYTEDALSPREASVTALKARLIQLLAGGEEAIRCGDLNYPYFRDDLEEWLGSCTKPTIDFEE